MRQCPALFIAAPSSGEGKTTVTAGIARYFTNQGKQVKLFKIGPDYLDPMILEVASGNSVDPLDLWMVGEAQCKAMLYEAAQEYDLLIIEGAMGLFDGSPSGADLAELFGIPVVIVINARSMAQTFGAIAAGMARFRPQLNIAGVVAVRTRSDWHDHVVTTLLPEDITFLGSIHEDETAALPSRHLGLIQAVEVDDLDERLNNIAALIAHTQLSQLPAPCQFEQQAVDSSLSSDLLGQTIGVARDEAFSFIYHANIRCLKNQGAEIVYFSPIYDSSLPEVDSLWLPGGYPELHLGPLAANETMLESIRRHYDAGKKIIAECGGMLYLAQWFKNLDGETVPLVGVIPGEGAMKTKGGCQGMQTLALPEGNLRGHAHHRCVLNTELVPLTFGQRTRSDAPGEAIYRNEGLTASFLHAYFPSNPQALIRLFKP